MPEIRFIAFILALAAQEREFRERFGVSFFRDPVDDHLMGADGGQADAKVTVADPVFWQQVKVLTVANLKSRYRKTIAGFVWVVANPLLMYGVQSHVFSKFLKLDVPNYSLFLLSGLLPWIFITQSLEMCTSIFMTSGRLLKSFPVNPLVYLLAQLVDNMVNFLAAFALVLIPLWAFHPGKSFALLLLPIPMALLAAGVLGLAWLLATLQVFYRDTRFLVTFGMSISFFLTPVFYPIDFVPLNVRWMIYINPFFQLITPFRAVIYEFSWMVFARSVTMASLVAMLFLFLANLYWRRKRNAFYLHI